MKYSSEREKCNYVVRRQQKNSPGIHTSTLGPTEISRQGFLVVWKKLDNFVILLLLAVSQKYQQTHCSAKKTEF